MNSGNANPENTNPSCDRGEELVEIQRQRILMAAPFNVILRGKDEKILNEAALDVFMTTREREELLSR